jgi:hypothetical protein
MGANDNSSVIFENDTSKREIRNSTSTLMRILDTSVSPNVFYLKTQVLECQLNCRSDTLGVGFGSLHLRIYLGLF